MKITKYTFPESSFLSIEKDLGLIVDLMMKNNRLKKLLYYTSSDCLIKNNLTEDESLSLFGEQIKILPKIKIDNELLVYVVITFDNFIPTDNPEFRDNIITFDIICHYDQWNLKDFELRPFKIAGEIDSMLNNKHLSGIGTLNFTGAEQTVFNDEYAGISLIYIATHGDEDKKNMPNPADEASFIEDFNETYNQ